MKNFFLILILVVLSCSLATAQVDKAVKWWDTGANQFKVAPIPFIPMDSATAAPATPTVGKAQLYWGLGHKLWLKWCDGTSSELSQSGAGITSLNSLTGSSQTFATGTTGTDFSISSATTTHTFNIPSASATARGLVTNTTQTFAGVKTFNDNIILTSTKGIQIKNSSSTMGIYNTNSSGYLDFITDPDGSPSTWFSLRPTGLYIIGMIPFSNASYDVGSSSYKFRDGYFSGNIVGSWNGSAIGTAKGGTSLTSAGSLGAVLTNTTGSDWTATVPYYNGTLKAAGDTAFVAITGIDGSSHAYASWGNVGATNVPLGALYIKEIGTNYIRIRSNSDEQVDLPIVVTVTGWGF